MACRWQPRGKLSSRLMHELQRRTALACVLCDRGAQRPFPRKELLLRHVQEAHDHRLCSLCMEVRHGAGPARGQLVCGMVWICCISLDVVV